MFGNWGSTLRKNSLTLILSILLLIFGISDSVIAAEQIHASYSALKISIPISALESYAKYGVISADLAGYYQYIPTNKLQELRKILIQPLKISPAVAAQFLETQQGKFILQRLAELIQTKSDYPKFVSSSLRTALIAAAAEPGGLNVLNLLRKYPQNNINIDVASSLEIAEELEQMIRETEKIISALIQISKLEAAKIYPSSFSQLPELANQRIFSAKKQTINFFDSSRNRHLSTDIYIPNTKNPAPVIVISHGLGLDSSNFRYLANHLVKNGFAVVIPNHAGSDAQQLQSLI
ncbi:MAG: alpha/beta hydrolase [Aphanizomenon sp.]